MFTKYWLNTTKRWNIQAIRVLQCYYLYGYYIGTKWTPRPDRPQGSHRRWAGGVRAKSFVKTQEVAEHSWNSNNSAFSAVEIMVDFNILNGFRIIHHESQFCQVLLKFYHPMTQEENWQILQTVSLRIDRIGRYNI